MEATTKQRNAPARRAGRHFLQIPGPSNVPDRILRAIDKPTIDHRGPEFATLGLGVLAGLKTIFRTASQVLIFPGSGTGAWEAATPSTGIRSSSVSRPSIPWWQRRCDRSRSWRNESAGLPCGRVQAAVR